MQSTTPKHRSAIPRVDARIADAVFAAKAPDRDAHILLLEEADDPRFGAEATPHAPGVEVSRSKLQTASGHGSNVAARTPRDRQPAKICANRALIARSSFGVIVLA